MSESSPMAPGTTSLATTDIAAILKNQYRAALTMLREAIELCPDGLWARESDLNKTWQIAYHALYFVHLYSEPGLEDFVPWPGQHPASQNDDAIPGPPDLSSPLPLIPEPYTKSEVLEYHACCLGRLESAIDQFDLESASSGFDWYPIPKLEHQFVTLRHVAQHTGQIMERVRSAGGDGVRWRGSIK